MEERRDGTPRWAESAVRVRDWPLAAKVVALSVAVSTALSIGLTATGYVQASRGLRDQAEAALEADARLVVSVVDEWNARRLADLEALARMPAARRLLEAPGQPASDDVEELQGMLASVDGVAAEVDSIGLLDSTGTFIASSNQKDIGSSVKQRDYFQEALQGRTFITGVSISTITNNPSIFHSVPVKGSDGKPIGVLRSRAALDRVQQAVEAARSRVGEGARGVLLDENGLVIATSVDPSWLLRPVVPLKPEASEALAKDKRWGNNPAPGALGQTDLAGAVGISGKTPFAWEDGGSVYQGVALPLEQTRWTYAVALPVATFEAAAREFLRNAVVGALLGLLLAAVAITLATRPIGRALRQVAHAAERVAEGDLDQEIQARSRDEVGRMAEAFRRMVAYQQQMAAVAGAIADGDLTRQVRAHSDRDALGRAFARMSANLRDLVDRVQVSVDQLTATAGQLGTAASHAGAAVQQVTAAMQNVAAGAQNTMRSVQETNMAVGQLGRVVEGIARGAADQAQQVQQASATASRMAAGIQQVAANATNVATTSQQAREAAEEGARSVRQTIAAMSQIERASSQAAERVQTLGTLGQKIGAVVETIDDIAEQTNLLALNAAIEAARAGEHGRGFAVVADEVRKLAERSGRETRQIAELIQQVQDGTEAAVAAMASGTAKVQEGSAQADQAGRALGEILKAVEATVAQVDSIAGAAKEVAEGAQSVVDAMQSISAVVEENTAATEEMAAQAGQVTGAIQSIASVAEEQSAATEEVSASAEEMSAQVQEMSAQARELAATAEQLAALVARFRVASGERGSEAVVPLRLVA